jgi:glycosyltransferase involved in cell wall biosynthesis
MVIAAFLLNTLLLLIALINFALLRRPAKARAIKESVAILLPVRNEAENIERILNELLAQRNLNNFQIIVINDNSEDETAAIASNFKSPQITFINAPAPLPGWIGKVSALDFGFTHLGKAHPDYVVSIDADVSFKPDAISRAIVTAQDLNLDFLSPYPRQIAITWAERLIQPLLQWSWMSTVLLRGAEKIPMKSTVICNGQFLVMKTQSLIQSGSFAAVSQYVLDDIELGRAFVRAGFRGVVIDGSELAATRMYSSFSEIKAGYGKSLHRAFGGVIGALFVTLFMALSAIIPVLYSLSGNFLALAALIAVVATRMLSAYSSSSRIRDCFLHPISALLFLYLLYYSWSHRSQVQWKGRTI